MSHPSHLLGAYLDGELSPANAAEVREHLVSCAVCAAEVDELRALGRLMSAARRSGFGTQAEGVTSDAMDRLRLHVRGLVESSDMSLVWMARIFSGVAASVLLAGLWLVSQAPNPQNAQQSSGQVVLRSLLTPETQEPSETNSQATAVAGLDGTSRDAVLARLIGIADSGAGESEAP